ncbi:MAG: 30S ribosomal protein S9 [Candidatus Dependentiae bacterium]|nr:30S ribosomal protein S9 [Candidatus Dependentiae bacterium]
MLNQKAAKETDKVKQAGRTPLSHGVGRRKSSVARVWLTRGSGKIVVNGLSINEYFDTIVSRKSVQLPFEMCPMSSNYDVKANVSGGGKEGQADAVKLGIARALLKEDETLRPALRKYDLLTSDSRLKERKKYGQKAARRKFQFVKR